MMRTRDSFPGSLVSTLVSTLVSSLWRVARAISRHAAPLALALVLGGTARAQAPAPTGKPAAAPAAAATAKPAPAAAAKPAPAAAAPGAAGPKTVTVSAPPPPPPPAPAVPKPAPELKELDWLKGTWRCTGKVPAGMTGPGSVAHSYRSTFKVTRGLNDFWFIIDYEQKKSGEHNLPVKAHVIYGWDAAGKSFVGYAFDSFGGVSAERGTVQDGNWSAAGDQMVGTQKVPYRETITKKSDKEAVMKGEWKMAHDWETVFEDTCKK